MAKVKGSIQAGTKKLVADVDGHEVVIDYPVSNDPNYETEGPTPGAMQAFALAGCKAILCSTYFMARKKDVEVEVEVLSTTEMDPETRKYRASYTVDLKLIGDVSARELAQIKQVVDQRCVVEHIITGSDNEVATRYSIEPY